jgi:hypothetical protein
MTENQYIKILDFVKSNNKRDTMVEFIKYQNGVKLKKETLEFTGFLFGAEISLKLEDCKATAQLYPRTTSLFDVEKAVITYSDVEAQINVPSLHKEFELKFIFELPKA